ncbi:hypothetical protein IW261DRAFT_1612332 [Armillaria novae-zelandiae]|uniref:Uncharacterized protein n=1 Tax=Armillaria novae-zelandiae TaxID=153914 RepID=A0AA39NSH3_9AGAR|nr:hypothetical protein IW261DRAFT_1612332 [Armillaria novae-zelandiae]
MTKDSMIIQTDELEVCAGEYVDISGWPMTGDESLGSKHKGYLSTESDFDAGST